MEDPVTITREANIAIVEVNNPPVNAASHAVRLGLQLNVKEAEANPEVEAILICCAGRTFIAGADIKEFGKPPQDPSLPDLVNQIEASTKPVIVAIHGTALGGGLEVAMGGHYRVALTSAKMGLPEVNLGILPGAGGTQRLPRLIPVAKAAEMITSAGMISAKEGHELGLIDRLDEGDDPRAAGLAYAKDLLAEGAGPSRTSDNAAKDADAVDFDALRAKVKKSARGIMAPVKALDAVEGATTMPFAEGLKNERALFTELLESDQRAALIHAFFAERSVAKVKEIEGVAPRPTDKIGVVGGGTMGAGIATSALLAGIDVTLAERDDDAANKARATVEKNLAGAVKRGKLAQAKHDAILANAFRTTTDYADFGERDLVIEAVFESMEVKREVFGQLDAVCKPGAVLATNTSYLDINEIAAATKRPGDVLGLHFFSPAHVMKLLEVVVADQTDPTVTATGFALGKKMKKIAVRAGVCDGFIGNRILSHYQKANFATVLAGASPFDVDRALTNFGLAMGPFAVSDLAGLDIGWANRKRLAETRDPRETYAAFADKLCEQGHFGRKTGKGFYIYEEGEKPQPNPEVEEIIAAERAEKGITPRQISDEEIVDRYMAAMVNEAARVVGDGIAQRPSDVDVVLLNGYGFPRWRGGPMHYADTVGLAKILNDIGVLQKEDDFLWQPAPLLKQLVEEDRNFASLNG
ncbi:3-hydroxyacyl-CoA dehydrogenase NAD-binding domain-containing protein [Roseovarius indicus]|uniref:3-hydroxyacyl-CoA dehydrogenase n=1 Tax=Roseovarius indicus TaxID=540747 RepID=A0A0T5P2X5_9RHOB|nr:3-hydroxyacyl-CoA dehydrogenase NAD-binding domain-containing protein [Roseovarius indicus]KRS15412.1 3-hydroxyacyl-CoA dehydrogenase [Roseovarius indicus]QEW28557.1 Fatty acid oxidation complex subunit alpha [Roseovarius indicus]SFE66766.1 short chain enoyl-CoA hydratase /3-hydroxyacyl-CoA dehydrogenase [Roseovarius indicus]